MERLIKKALDQTNTLRHPLHDLVDLINKTPADMIKLKFEQGEDGSKKFQIDIPSRAEQAKQKALEQAMQMQGQGGQGQAGAQMKSEVNDMMSNKPAGTATQSPSGAGAGAGAAMPSAGQDKMPAAAASNVQIRVAMVPEKPEDAHKLAKKEWSGLKTQYPTNFLKSMGL